MEKKKKNQKSQSWLFNDRVLTWSFDKPDENVIVKWNKNLDEQGVLTVLLCIGLCLVSPFVLLAMAGGDLFVFFILAVALVGVFWSAEKVHDMTKHVIEDKDPMSVYYPTKEDRLRYSSFYVRMASIILGPLVKMYPALAIGIALATAFLFGRYGAFHGFVMAFIAIALYSSVDYLIKKFAGLTYQHYLSIYEDTGVNQLEFYCVELFEDTMQKIGATPVTMNEDGVSYMVGNQ